MTAINEMLSTHPQKPTHHFDLIAETIAACYECAQVCVTCADACLAEEQVADLRQCIRLDLDCADICNATGRLIARQARPEPDLWRAILEACAEACRSCAAECARHQNRFEHCRVCKDACVKTEQLCRQLLSSLPTGGAETRH